MGVTSPPPGRNSQRKPGSRRSPRAGCERGWFGQDIVSHLCSPPAARGSATVCDTRRMMTLLKRAFLRTLEQHGYLLLKKAEYAHVPEAVPTSSFERLVALEDQPSAYRIRHQICIADVRNWSESSSLYEPKLQRKTTRVCRLSTLFTSSGLPNSRNTIVNSPNPPPNTHCGSSKLERAIGGALPDFDNDDGTLEFASVSGVYVPGAEAPLAEDRLVTPAVANPAGTTVILTFGQSNAANSGEERYAARGRGPRLQRIRHEVLSRRRSASGRLA